METKHTPRSAEHVALILEAGEFERWCAYFTLTDDFDDAHCTAPAMEPDGSRMPANPWERANMSAHALRVRDELFLRRPLSDEERDAALRMTRASRREVAERAGLLALMENKAEGHHE